MTSSWGTSSYHLSGGEGALTLVTSAPSGHDVKQGDILTRDSPLGRILDEVLVEAGIMRDEINILSVSRRRPIKDEFKTLPRKVLEEDVKFLRETISRLRPKTLVALGPYAAHVLIPEWPDARSPEGLTHKGNLKNATDIENRRGYIFDSPLEGCQAVLATISPNRVAMQWAPWRVLLSYDLQRAQEIHLEGFERPSRDVVIVRSDRDARLAVKDLRRFQRLSGDIETWRDTTLACIGFAGESGKAYVFPTRYSERASELLRDPELTTIWANGIYDLFVLKHRRGWEISSKIEDVQIAWHSCFPELAGQKEDKKKQRHTRKSLSFLASLVTKDRWWKGDYETKDEFYIYNGKDCCITLEIDEWIQPLLDEIGARPTYELECSLMMPCVDMLQRGLHVDDTLRRARIESLEKIKEDLAREAQEVAIPLLERESERLDKAGLLKLFQETDPTCPCCGHGKKKQTACWGCLGFPKSPTKVELMEKFNISPKVKKTKKELEAMLPVCHVCCGHERETRLVFNPNSDTQVKVLMYEVLRLPKRTKRNSKGVSVVTTDAKALKSLAGVVEEKLG